MIITDKQYHEGHNLMDVTLIATMLHGTCEVTIPVKEYQEDAEYPYEYQAFWHPINEKEFDNACTN